MNNSLIYRNHEQNGGSYASTFNDASIYNTTINSFVSSVDANSRATQHQEIKPNMTAKEMGSLLSSKLIEKVKEELLLEEV